LTSATPPDVLALDQVDAGDPSGQQLAARPRRRRDLTPATACDVRPRWHPGRVDDSIEAVDALDDGALDEVDSLDDDPLADDASLGPGPPLDGYEDEDAAGIVPHERVLTAAGSLAIAVALSPRRSQ
jgi:hypothetical protein